MTIEFSEKKFLKCEAIKEIVENPNLVIENDKQKIKELSKKLESFEVVKNGNISIDHNYHTFTTYSGDIVCVLDVIYRHKLPKVKIGKDGFTLTKTRDSGGYVLENGYMTCRITGLQKDYDEDQVKATAYNVWLRLSKLLKE